jgi:hypothetical protein
VPSVAALQVLTVQNTVWSTTGCSGGWHTAKNRHRTAVRRADFEQHDPNKSAPSTSRPLGVTSHGADSLTIPLVLLVTEGLACLTRLHSAAKSRTVRSRREGNQQSCPFFQERCGCGLPLGVTPEKNGHHTSSKQGSPH